MTIFDFEEYKKFVLKVLKTYPNHGYGQFSKIAQKLNIHTSLVSQVFQGDKHLSFEQACDLCQFFGLTELETDYFVALVLKERAGNEAARKKCAKDLEKIKSKAAHLEERISNDVILNDADSATFFSHWSYTAIKLLVSLVQDGQPSIIAKKLNLPLESVNKVIEFLTQTQLCLYKDGKLTQGPSKLHIAADSPFVSRHHLNWRIKALDKIGYLKPDEFSFTMPTNVSLKDAAIIRQQLIEIVDQTVKVVDNSKPEAMFCLNLDWFHVLESKN